MSAYLWHVTSPCICYLVHKIPGWVNMFLAERERVKKWHLIKIKCMLKKQMNGDKIIQYQFWRHIRKYACLRVYEFWKYVCICASAWACIYTNWKLKNEIWRLGYKYQPREPDQILPDAVLQFGRADQNLPILASQLLVLHKRHQNRIST